MHGRELKVERKRNIMRRNRKPPVEIFQLLFGQIFSTPAQPHHFKKVCHLTSLFACKLISLNPTVHWLDESRQMLAFDSRKTGQSKEWVARLIGENHLAQHLAHRRSVLEAVSRAAAGQPDVGRGGMAIQDEMTIRSVFIMADPRFQQGSILQGGKAVCQIAAGPLDAWRAGNSFSGSGLKRRSAGIVSHLEAAPLVSRDGIEKVVIFFHADRHIFFGKSQVAGGSSKEENLLPGGRNQVSHLREHGSQPRATSKDKLVGNQGGAIVQLDLPEFPAFHHGRLCESLPILAAFGEECFEHNFTGAPGGEVARIFFQEQRGDPVEVYLWILFAGRRG